MGNSFMDIHEIADTLPVKNRMVDAKVTIQHDRQELVWEPQEIKMLPRAYAHWFINRSTRKRDLKGKAKLQQLVIVGSGKDESPLEAKLFVGPMQLVDKPWFDKDGTPLREVYIDKNSTGVEEIAAAIENREQVTHDAKTAEIRDAVAEKTIERVAQAMDPAANESATS